MGLALVAAGALRLGFVADLLSIPVTTGFLAGVAVHIVASQAPALLGLAPPSGPTPERLWALARGLGAAQPLAVALGLGVTAARSRASDWRRAFPPRWRRSARRPA